MMQGAMIPSYKKNTQKYINSCILVPCFWIINVQKPTSIGAWHLCLIIIDNVVESITKVQDMTFIYLHHMNEELMFIICLPKYNVKKHNSIVSNYFLIHSDGKNTPWMLPNSLPVWNICSNFSHIMILQMGKFYLKSPITTLFCTTSCRVTFHDKNLWIFWWTKAYQ